MDFSRVPVENNIGYLFGLHQFAKIIGPLCKWLGIADQSSFIFPKRNVTLIKGHPPGFMAEIFERLAQLCVKRLMWTLKKEKSALIFRLQVSCQLSGSTYVAAFK